MRLLVIILASLTTSSAWAQNVLTQNRSKTFFQDGYAAAGFGEVGVNSQKILGEEAMLLRAKVGWQIARSEYAAWTLGAAATGLDQGVRYTAAEYDQSQFSIFGLASDLVIMPAWPAHLSVSGLAGNGKMERQREDRPDEPSALEKAHLESYDIGINGNFNIWGPAWIVLTYGQQIHNFDQSKNIEVRKERREYVSIAVRGSSM